LEVARVRPFPRSRTIGADLNIIFLTDPLDDQTRRRVVVLISPTDQFRVRGREIYWLRRKKPSTSNFSTVPLERVLSRRLDPRGCECEAPGREKSRKTMSVVGQHKSTSIANQASTGRPIAAHARVDYSVGLLLDDNRSLHGRVERGGVIVVAARPRDGQIRRITALPRHQQPHLVDCRAIGMDRVRI